MRGAISGGMLAALEDLQYRSTFDAVYGSSAGAFNAAFFITGQCSEALALYYDNMTRTELYDPRRLLKGQPLVSVDWLLEFAIEDLIRLDWASLLASPIHLNVIASSLTTLQTVTLNEFSDHTDLKDALKASARIPLLAGAPVEFHGDRLLDAAVLQGHPYESALADGCTHILSLSTRPRGKLRPEPGPWEWLTSLWLDKRVHGLGKRYLNRIRAARDAQLELVKLNEIHREPPFVLDVAPARDTPEVGLLDSNVSRILAGARAGYEACFMSLEQRRVRAYFRLAGITQAPARRD